MCIRDRLCTTAGIVRHLCGEVLGDKKTAQMTSAMASHVRVETKVHVARRHAAGAVLPPRLTSPGTSAWRCWGAGE
eukprot:15250438-Alexandrium_andersonii.AAC.1